jgi:hypothetical protein
MSADRHDDEARRLLADNPAMTWAKHLANALRAAERRGAERMQWAAAEECALRGAVAATQRSMAQIIERMDLDALLAGET